MTVNDQTAGRPDILVRPLAAGDWRQARSTRLAALADAPYAFASTLAKELAYDDDHWRRRAGSGRTMGAFDGESLVGVAGGIPTDELDGRGTPGRNRGGTPDTASGGDRPDRVSPDWQLVGMWVAPDYRGLGVGDQLIQAICDRARAAGAATVTLWVTEINGRAMALYRRHGFAPNGTRELVRPEQPDHWEVQLVRPLR